MWGRSLYRNIQRFLIFQLIVNFVACATVLIGSFFGMEAPLTVTQMLWVNLIMDTFAAIAMASIPPQPSLMNEKPRSRSAFIVTKAMWTDIIGSAVVFAALLLTFLFYLEHHDITSLTQIGHVPADGRVGLSPYELSVFFSTFVFVQFWNMFNTRAFATGRSALHLGGAKGFILVALVIFIGQIALVTVGGRFFSTVPLSITDWCIIIGATSIVLWIGELYRLIKNRR